METPKPPCWQQFHVNIEFIWSLRENVTEDPNVKSIIFHYIKNHTEYKDF